VIEQHRLQQELQAEYLALGGALIRGVVLESFVQDDTAVAARLAGPDGGFTVRADWLVGCDGARSGVRRRLGIPFVGRAVPDLEVVQAKAEVDWPYDPARGCLFIAPGRALGAFPMPDGRRRFYCFKTLDGASDESPPSQAEVESLIGEVMGRPPLRLREAEWLSRARFQERIAARLRVGRVLLAGDAAHVWAAVGGHGMAVAVMGAGNLAWRLAAVARGEGPVELLDNYGEEQRAQAAAMIAKLKFDLLERPLPALAVTAVGLLGPAVLASAAARRAIERMLSDMDLHHRRSALSQGGGGRLDAGGAGRWRLLTGTGADVAVIGGLLAGRARIEVVAGAGRVARCRLVRPDGFVAYAGSIRQLEPYLDRWLPRRGGPPELVQSPVLQLSASQSAV
jgi:2-polyprenyl-6-methoxyphenol hydroxylase-like FAD-dependent oxidoreductase